MAHVNMQTISHRNDFTQLWCQCLCLLEVKIHPTSYRFNRCRSYTDVDLKLDGFIRILAGLLTNYEVGNGNELSGDFFCIVLRIFLQ